MINVVWKKAGVGIRGLSKGQLGHDRGSSDGRPAVSIGRCYTIGRLLLDTSADARPARARSERQGLVPAEPWVWWWMVMERGLVILFLTLSIALFKGSVVGQLRAVMPFWSGSARYS